MAREMKDSGIEWIGEIPKEWELVQLRRFVNINNGREIRREVSKDYSGAIGVYGSGGIFKYTDEMQYSGKAVMFGRKGTLGKPLYVDDSFWTVDTMYFLTYKNGLDERFNYYQLIVFDWEPYITHTAIPSIVASQIVACHFPIPNRCEQNRIAAYLDKICVELDNVLEKTRASIEEYKKLKQAVITQAVTKGVRGNREMKDSGIEWIGEIPVDWNLIKITRLLDYNHPYSIGDGDHGLIKTDDYIDTGIPYIRVQNLGWGTELNYDNMVYISEDRNQMIANSILKPDDILFAKTGATIGKTSIIPDSMPVSNTTSHIGKITVSPNYNPKYIFYVMSSYLVYRQFWEMAGLKSTRPELSIDEIKKIRLIIPSRTEEQEGIARYLDEKCSAIDELIAKKEQYLSEIENYKKSLIYEYVTGKKEVPQE